MFYSNWSIPDEAQKFLWSDIALGEVLPEPKSHLGEIAGNTNESLRICIYKTSTNAYNKYVDSCIESGFTVEADRSETSYSAYNADGYGLSLLYNESNKAMEIHADAAKQYGALVWPASGIAGMLPVPTSATGEITQDDEHGFQAYVSGTPIDAFHAYAAACADMGFDIEASDSDKSYSAENSEGYKLSVSYQGNGVVSISVDEPEYEVSVEIECAENWFFSKYNVDVYIDDSLQGTIAHGGTEVFELTLTKGNHVITFVNNEDDSVNGKVAFYIQKDENLKYKISCKSSDIAVDTITGASAASETTDRAPKNGFDPATNEVYTLASYTIEIPTYWTAENKIDGGFQRYAESGGKTALLQIIASPESDDSYPVTFDGLMDDNDNMIAALESTTFKEVTGYEIIDTGVIKGILYKGTFVIEGSELTGYAEWFAFASENDRTWCNLVCGQTDNSEYTYADDFMKMIQSIKPLANAEDDSKEPTETEPAESESTETGEPAIPAEIDSEYEKAYIRVLGTYDLYYMFDTDTNSVVYFGTNDTCVDRGTYTGDFSTGVTISWSHGEWQEKFVHSSGNIATTTDGNGFEWEYEVCDVSTAQKVLDDLQ